MRTAEKIEQLLKKYFKASQPSFTANDERDKHTIDIAMAAYNNSSKKLSAKTTQGAWRIIMKSKFTKSAVAAALVFGVFMTMTISGGSGVAWADVVEQIRSLQTMQCISTVEIKEDGANDDLFRLDIKSRVFIKDPGLSRVEILHTSGTVSDVIITKQTRQKNVRITYKPDGPMTYHRRVENINSDAGGADNAVIRMWTLIEKLTSDQTRKGDTQEIMGVETVVFSASLKEVFPECPYPGLTKVWVNSKTAAPVRVRTSFEDETGIMRRLTFDNIQWDIPLSDDIFEAPKGWQAIEDQSRTIQLENKKLKQGVKFLVQTVDGKSIVTEADIESLTAANLVKRQGRQDIQLTVVLKEDARQRVKTYMTEHVGRKMLMEFDGQYKYEPRIMAPISGKAIMIMLPATDMTLKDFQEKYLE